MKVMRVRKLSLEGKSLSPPEETHLVVDDSSSDSEIKPLAIKWSGPRIGFKVSWAVENDPAVLIPILVKEQRRLGKVIRKTINQKNSVINYLRRLQD